MDKLTYIQGYVDALYGRVSQLALLPDVYIIGHEDGTADLLRDMSLNNLEELKEQASKVMFRRIEDGET